MADSVRDHEPGPMAHLDGSLGGGEAVRAARRGLEFDPVTGEPALWAIPARPAVTWHVHAVAYAAMKGPALSAHSRASLADALAIA
jgi:hypothetical protein